MRHDSRRRHLLVLELDDEEVLKKKIGSSDVEKQTPE
jgi:hypothetical protein